MRSISFEEELEADIIVLIDDSLADMLINNLLKNVVHDNVEDGWIKVILTSKMLN